MRVLLVYPRFPKSLWSFEAVVEFMNRKVLMPPLGLATVAALLPVDWEVRLVDTALREVTPEEWAWSDVVMLTGMVVQKGFLAAEIARAKAYGKLVVVGGPCATSQPRAVQAMGADFLVLDEGEITIPLLVQALARGETSGWLDAGGAKPDVTESPIPRFELLDLGAYDTMSVQFSRGCPFLCEFCDIIALYGRRPRTKTPAQLLAELDRLRELGWTRSVFIVDDNFIGNRRETRRLLLALRDWQRRQPFPYALFTEASIDLAQDPELLRLMVECGFFAVFLGLETPDEDSLKLTRKKQNLRQSMVESVDVITRAGLRPMAGFIIGFDGERPGAGERMEALINETDIPVAFLSLLQALPGTALSNRLEAEGRLLGDDADVNQTALMNFEPTRPIAQIANEYVETFHRIYDPVAYLHRVHRCCLKLGRPPRWDPPKQERTSMSLPTRAELADFLVSIRSLLIIIWRQGVRRSSRWVFWHHGLDVLFRNPWHIGQFIQLCAQEEHFLPFRDIVRREIGAALRRQGNAIGPLAQDVAGTRQTSGAPVLEPRRRVGDA